MLLAIVKSSIVKKHGMKKLLEPFLSDIEILQRDGISIIINEEEIIYKGSLLFCAGDTPASAYIGGYKESVAAYRNCRTCMTSGIRWKLNFHQDDFIMRDAETHQEQTDVVTQPHATKQISNFWKRRYGINGESLLNSVGYFDVTKCLPQDPMHVLIEGVLVIEIKLLLHYFIIEKEFFTVDDFNMKISCFDFNHFKRNKPADIAEEQLTQDGSLRQSASQICTLAYTLPFLICDWI